MTQRYTLSVTAEQAGLISLCCEAIARMRLGQSKDAFEQWPFADLVGAFPLLDQIDTMLRNQPRKPGQEHSHREPWDIHHVIRHRLAWDRAVRDGLVESIDSPRKWPEMMGVQYDAPSGHDLPTIAPAATTCGWSVANGDLFATEDQA